MPYYVGMKNFTDIFSSYGGCLPKGLLLPEVKIDQKHYERLKISDSSSNFDFLKQLCLGSFNKLTFKNEEEKTKYHDRMNHELALFYELNFTDYLLLTWDIIEFCKESQIPTGMGRGCLHQDSPIKTEKGIKKISEVNSGDLVINKLGKRDRVLSVHKWKFIGNLVGIRVFSGSGRPIFFTGDHHILRIKDTSLPYSQENTEWVEASSVKKGDYLIRFPLKIQKQACPTVDISAFFNEFDDSHCYEKVQKKEKGPLSWRQIQRETKLQYKFLNFIYKNGFGQNKTHSHPLTDRLKNYLNKNGLSEKDFLEKKHYEIRKYSRYMNSYDFGYIVGFYAGDGSISTGGSCTILSVDSKDKSSLSKITCILEKHGLKFSISEQSDCGCTHISINSRRFSLMMSYYCSGKTVSNTKRFNSAVYSFCDDSLLGLIDGLVDSDGHRDKYGNLSFYNTSENIVNTFREIYEMIYRKPISINIFSGEKRITRNSRDAFHCYTVKSTSGKTILPENNSDPILCMVMEKTTQRYNGYVYDLVVDEDPSFSTSDFIVHNSSAGSLVLFLMGITGIDPIKNGLYFERFLSRARARQFIENGVKYFIDSPDIDNDISYDRRQEVIDYIYSKYPDYVSSISTFATLSGKLCVKECIKIVDEDGEEVAQHIADSIPKVFGKVMPLIKAREKSEKFKKWADKHERTFLIASQLEGLIKNTSVHPSGVAIGSKKIMELSPVSYDSTNRPVSSYEMDTVSNLMIKVDILGLRTLSVIDDVCKRLNIDWKKIDTNDPFIYGVLQKLDTPKGIFQIEAGATFQVCQKVKPRNLSELSDVIALSRPGAMAFVDDYVDIKNGNKIIPERHAILDEILRETKGIIIYQESLMKIAHEVFGLSLEDAEMIRRSVSKKKHKEMKKWEKKIRSQGKKLEIDKSIVDFCWDAFNAAADYSFNKSHSVSYATLSAITTYLKYKYPQEFFISLLKMSQYEPKPHEEIRIISNELRNFGVELLPPDLARSEMEFSIEGKNIRYGLKSIKGISEKSLEALTKFRSSSAPNKLEIFQAAKEAGLNIGILSALIQAGTLGDYREKRARTVFEAQCFNILTDREKRNLLIFAKDFDFDLLKCMKFCHDNNKIADDQRVLFKESRWQTIIGKLDTYRQIYSQNSKYENFANWFFEKKLLGYSPNIKLKDVMGDGFNDSEDISNMHKWTKYKLIGTVDISKKAKSAAGNPYIMLSVFDDSGSFKALLCDNQRYKKCTEYIESGKKIPEKDDIVIIIGSPSDDGTIFIEDMSIMSEKIYMKLSDIN